MVGPKGSSDFRREANGKGLMLLWEIFLEELDFDTYLEGDGCGGLKKRNNGI